ncbi:hypothetical protein GLYMA_12G168100v4 [Glycine max]|uniref:PB1-like domain-containing protein n=2 Tax=Glycine subgen. Soja TaxID=1462606 RepID=A0A0R0H680_SOYBN|nr:hypothetical protein GYH30_034000 [Glycine max]KRH26334.1 hypothetical protein GLYMA_12G168100v4 [Glycine max]
MDWTREEFMVVMHHMGKFKFEPSLHYADVKKDTFHGLNIDTWSFFEGVGLLKGLVYDGKMKFWWKAEDAQFEGNLKPFMNDNDALKLPKFALLNKCKVGIYVEHTVSIAEIVEQVDDDTVNVCGKEQLGSEDGHFLNVGESENVDGVGQSKQNSSRDVCSGELAISQMMKIAMTIFHKMQVQWQWHWL